MRRAPKRNATLGNVLLGCSILIIILLAAVVLTIRASSEAPRAVPHDTTYRDPTVKTKERIEDLLHYMTLEEKVGQMALVDKNSIHTPSDVVTYRLGALLSGAGAKPEENTKEGWLAMVRSYDELARSTRLGIPLLYGVDANHGHGNVPGATVFPHAIGLGATGDANLVRRIGQATAEELAVTGISWNFAPALDLPTDVRWGRVYESYSDDPVLTGMLGRAYLEGLQAPLSKSSTSTKEIHVLGTPKHYIGLGAMLWGSSRNEKYRIDQGRTPPDETRLRSEYLPPFEEAIDAGALSIMVGLNWWGDVDLAAHKHLIDTVLKQELGFSGFVVSDWYGVYEIPGGRYKATVRAINAGVDMVMLPFDYDHFTSDVMKAVRRGDIEETRIDDAVRRILYAKFKLGLFDNPVGADDLSAVGSEAHRALAREAVARSVVVLKDPRTILPLTPQVRHIRVAGSAAHNIGRQAGAWTVEWQGIDGNWLPGATSILDGIRQVAGYDVNVEYATDGVFATATTKAELGIAVVGETPYAEGWGDSALPHLSDEDIRAIASLQQGTEKVLVILVTGRPLIITEHLPGWDATLVAWLPGSEGAGIADALFGITSSYGTLPVPWPRHTEQLPISVHGITTDGTSLLFPRGHGVAR